jgi:predicted extracellular nuclease
MLRPLFLVLPFLGTALLAQTPICTIQGSGAASSLDGQVVTTTGTVTAVFQGAGTVQGYFIEDPACDADVATSNGIFVYQTAAPGIAVGQRIQVTGTVDEFQGLTEIRSVSAVQQLGAGSVPPTQLLFPIADLDNWERYEGMLLRFPQALVVNSTGNWLQYGEVVLGPERAYTATQLVDPNDAVATGTSTTGAGNVPAVLAREALNDRGRIILDDGRTFSYPDPPPLIGAEGTLRTGSTITDLTAVLHYAFDEYRLHPVGTVPIIHDPRPEVPAVGGSVRVASLNVLNYFTTLGVWGAATTAERQRQRTKLVAALQAVDADAVVLCELENNDVAWADLLAAVNAAMGPGTYQALEEDAFGSGGTKSVIFYKPSVLSATGPLYELSTFTFQRPHLTQAFTVNASGGRFLLSSMHLRSKLCDNATGNDLDQGDGQGCFNALRRTQAQELVAFWAGIRNSTGIAAQVVVGDMNAYAQEDPLDVFRAAGLSTMLDEADHSYRFGGTFGALDHVLATDAMASVMSAAAVWHINSDEPAQLDYQADNLAYYQPNAFRCSDHDMLVLGLEADDLNVGVDEHPLSHGIQAWVDVNSRHVQWTSGAEPLLDLHLMDVQGRLLMRHAGVASQGLWMDLSSLPAGVYLWRCALAHGQVARGTLVLP